MRTIKIILALALLFFGDSSASAQSTASDADHVADLAARAYLRALKVALSAEAREAAACKIKDTFPDSGYEAAVENSKQSGIKADSAKSELLAAESFLVEHKRSEAVEKMREYAIRLYRCQEISDQNSKLPKSYGVQLTHEISRLYSLSYEQVIHGGYEMPDLDIIEQMASRP